MTRLLLRLIPAHCWRDSWHAACAVVGGLAVGLAALGLLDATRPLGLLLLRLAGSH